jgi:alcohol dehydrogenase
MSLMKTAQIKSYGDSEVVEINPNAPSLNDPSEAMVLVTVKAAGVNPSDWKLREGFFKEMVPLQFPATLGSDFSGVIEKVGERVSSTSTSISDLKLGDEVYGHAGAFAGGSGAFAEMALAKADTIAHKPRTLDHKQAAGLPLVGVSAWQALVETIGLTKGQKILIHGGAGGIGSIAIQLGKYLGAYVATTVSTNDIQFVKEELGADEAIDYKTLTFEDVLPHDFDAVFDTVGGETYTRSFKVFVFSQGNRERLTKLAEWVDQNNIRVNVERTFPLDEARTALDYQRGVHPRGKIVLAMQ